MHRVLFTIGLVALAPAAIAGDITAPVSDPAPVYAAPAPVDGPELVFTLRGGVAVAPTYFGSDEYEVGPDLGFSLNAIDLGGLKFGSSDPAFEPSGVALRGSFRFIGERDFAESPELIGLPAIDETYEIGLGLGYRSRGFDAFADLRYGFNGHESVVGELGADAKFYPTDRLTLTAGPRVLIGSDDYVSTYFDVPVATAAFPATFDGDGGVVSAGVELGATYQINDNWGVEGAVTYDRFMGDAADSPIVERGERDQYGLRVGLTRRITLDF